MASLTIKWASRLIGYVIILILFGIVMYLREDALLSGPDITTVSACGGNTAMMVCILDYQGVMQGLLVYGALFAGIGASILSFRRLQGRKNRLSVSTKSDSIHAKS